jgi:hypothetical protein
LSDLVADSPSAELATPKTGSPNRLLGKLAGAVFGVHTLSPSGQPSDSRLSVLTSWSALTRHTFRLDGYPQVAHLKYRADLVSRGGHVLPYFPWPTLLLATPATLLARLFGVDPASISISDPNRTFLLEVPTASLLVALTTVGIYQAVRRAAGEHRAALLAALLFAFASSAWSIASRALWQQTASMLFLTCAIVALQRLAEGRRWAYGAGAAITLCVLVRPTDAVFVVLALGYAALRLRSGILRVLLPMAGLLSVFFAVSYSQYGTVLPPYYQVGRRFSEPKKLQFWNGMLVNLISPNRGLLVYDSVIVLAAVLGTVLLWRSRRLRVLEVVMLLAIAGQLLTISRYGSTGGPTYGPRLMIDILPCLVILGAPAYRWVLRWRQYGRWARLVLAGCLVVLVWSVFVNATGAVLRSGYCWSAYPSLIDDAPQRVWSWSDPQFLRPYRDLADGDSIRQVAIGSCKEPAA